MTSKKHKAREVISLFCGLGIFLGVVALVVVIYLNSTSDIFSMYDPISGLSYDKALSSEESDETLYLGFEGTIEQYFSDDQTAEILEKIKLYISQTNPDAAMVSYHKNSLTKKEDYYQFKYSVDKAKYQVRLKPVEESDYELEIHNYNGVVYSYKSQDHRGAKRNALTLLNKELPVSLESDDLAFGVRSTDSKELQVIVNSCGDQSIKDRAIEATKNWLKSINYSPDDFAYIADDYCDE